MQCCGWLCVSTECVDLVFQSLDGVSREKLPRTLDECHKRIVVLQNQLKQTAKFSDDDDEGAIVKVPKMELAQVQAKMVLLEESERQLSETEKLVSHLRDTVAQLRQGKVRHRHRHYTTSKQNICFRIHGGIVVTFQTSNYLGCSLVVMFQDSNDFCYSACYHVAGF